MLELTIRRLKRSGFESIYRSLILGEELSERDKVKVLSVAVILINQSDRNLKNLGYRVVLGYGNLIGDYRPLYDISLNNGLIPVSASISVEVDNGFFSNFSNSYIEVFRDGSIVSTEQQYVLKKFFEENMENDASVVAPTSYGKSDLIISLISKLEGKRVCVIVPSKSLVSQTKKRILDAKIKWVSKVITHPEMYKKDTCGFVSVLTQERLSRLLYENQDISLDSIFIDEAHNIFGRDSRSELLASVLSIAWGRNKAVSFKYLTPFLVDSENLKLRYVDQEINNFSVSEYIKSEKIYLSDFRKGRSIHCIYDQFLNKFYNYDSKYGDQFDLIIGKSLNKNIIYFNKPKSIESFCSDFILKLDDVDCDIVNVACEAISEGVAPDYRLVECLRKGVVYHHGSMPESVKVYVEDVFRRSGSVKFLVTSSTLLEGVNFPAERLFILDNKKGTGNLTPSQFKNLVGRIGRFSEVFSSKEKPDLSLLEPHVYIVGTDLYTSRADLKGFLSRTMKVDLRLSDKLENLLLDNTAVNDLNIGRLESAKKRLENLQEGIVDDYRGEYVETLVGKALFVNNISEIDIFLYENEIQRYLDDYLAESGLITDTDELVNLISICFIGFIDDGVLSRLSNQAAKNYYSMFLNWMISNYSFSRMVANIVYYWNQATNPIVYVGKWGEIKYEGGFANHWVNIKEKNDVEIINLAIVRVKEEEDFVDYQLFRFIDVLNDCGLLDHDFYSKLKYGTTDEIRINLIKEGFSRPLSKLFVDKYYDFLKITGDGGVSVDGQVMIRMQESGENEMLIYEASMNIPV
ncbi:MAG: hypothetical protein ACI8SR_003001 [Oceanicoccus sp.]|jgi:hypothetical protein